MNHDPSFQPDDLNFRQLMHQHGIETIGGVQLLRAVRIVNNLYDVVFSERLRDDQLSGPRWGVLMHLYAEEMNGNTNGLSPSVLSRHQSVSKNTVSSLLRGLEEQGFIERQLDQQDRRSFTIRLTELARAQVRESAPAHVAFLNQLCADLSAQETATLLELLTRLRRSLLKQAAANACDNDTPASNPPAETQSI